MKHSAGQEQSDTRGMVSLYLIVLAAVWLWVVFQDSSDDDSDGSDDEGAGNGTKGANSAMDQGSDEDQVRPLVLSCQNAHCSYSQRLLAQAMIVRSLDTIPRLD